jgi:hypothetical protein
MIKNLTPRPAEKGRIKIGGLGDERKKKDGSGTYMLPVKYDHFEIVTMQRDAAGRFIKDSALMDRLMQAQNVQKLLEIPIRLLFDDPDLNFFTRYAAYSGKSIWCSGDGEEAQRIGKDGKFSPVQCPCEHLEATYAGQIKCKPLGNLRCLIEGVDRVGGIWSFRTTSWNTVNAILSSMALIRTITGGPLAGIPLKMVLAPKTVNTPDGKSMVAYIVSLEYRGAEEKLAELGYEIARRRAEHQIRMDMVEVEARKLLVAPHQEPVELQAETAAEFYPDTGEAPDTKKSPPPSPQEAPGAVAPSDPVHTPSSSPEPTTGPSTQSHAVKKGSSLTLPEVMEACEKQVHVELPVTLVTTEGVQIGEWVDRYFVEEMTHLVFEMRPDLAEVAQGLTKADIFKSFLESGRKVIFQAPGTGPVEQEEEPPTIPAEQAAAQGAGGAGAGNGRKGPAKALF